MKFVAQLQILSGSLTPPPSFSPPLPSLPILIPPLPPKKQVEGTTRCLEGVIGEIVRTETLRTWARAATKINFFCRGHLEVEPAQGFSAQLGYQFTGSNFGGMPRWRA